MHAWMALALVACATGSNEDDAAAWTPPSSSDGSSEGDTGEGDGSTTALPPDTTAALPGSTGDEPLPPATTGDSGDSGDSGEPQACDFVRIVGLGGEPLNVRQAPSVSAPAVGLLYEDQVVAAIDHVVGDEVSDPARGTTDAWVEIDGAGVQGFVTTLYTECTEEPEASEWVWPVPMTLSIVQDFGNPIAYQTCGFHTGIDVVGEIGDPVLAAADGVVVHVGPMWFSGDGQGRGPHAIILQHGDGLLYSTYGHNDAALVDVGESVIAGEPVAELGTLGYSSGPHLHFEIVEGTPFTGDWQVPFADACDHYRDPKAYVQP